MPQAAQGREGVLDAPFQEAYINTIYNTLGGMLTERLGGSQVDPTLMRAAGIRSFDGVPTGAGFFTGAIWAGIPAGRAPATANFRKR